MGETARISALFLHDPGNDRHSRAEEFVARCPQEDGGKVEECGDGIVFCLYFFLFVLFLKLYFYGYEIFS